MSCLRSRYLFFLLFPLAASAQRLAPPAQLANPAETRQAYQASLTQLRQGYPARFAVPELSFFLFGMGDRLKLIYRSGRLLNALTGNIEEQWTVKKEVIVPSEYTVHLDLADEPGQPPRSVQIREDEQGVWVLQPGKRPRLIPGTRRPLTLPRFADQPFGPVLRVLHHEVLINISAGRPLPNFMVYARPRYRDAALMAMVLRETGNLALIRDWIMALRDPLDRYQDMTGADNLGQVLFLVSLVSDKTHPVVAVALDSSRRAIPPPAEHGVYQTTWMNFGLASLGLPNPYPVPRQTDSYASLCWWARAEEPVPAQPVSAADRERYPYLAWASDHFRSRTGNRQKLAPVGTADYPLSWEAQTRDAHYPGLTVLDKGLVKQKLAVLHAWQAAEMFLAIAQP
ncbi:hypothetical protein [Spirosoma sp. 209]|uniref:hypothetical protein n=1 Tax=Spirosoma sp. 209 TaxID=1955701 RepID=UPI00098D749A|nr:hypothetical protein [Spirosoma sp. 209]